MKILTSCRIRLYFLMLFSVVPLAAQDPQKTTVKVLSFNILAGGGAVAEIGRSSPLFNKPRHAQIAEVITQCEADVVAVTEPNTAKDDPILALLQKADPKWVKHGQNLYSKFLVEPDPQNPGSGQTHRVKINEEQSLIVHVAHWRPNRGYGPDVVVKRILEKSVPPDAKQFEQEVLQQMSIPNTYAGTLKQLQPHLDAGRPVVLCGDFNEPSALDWTAEYAAKGADRWVSNPTKTPLRFNIAWPGSRTLLDAGMRDAFREIFPDPVAKPGNTWTPPYANETPGRRPYDGNTTTNGTTNQQLDRIDCIYFAGGGLEVKAAAVVGENPANPEHSGKSEITPDIQFKSSWPSDHRAVLATFTLTGVEKPSAAPKFKMVETGHSPFPWTDREDLSLNCGGGKGALISPSPASGNSTVNSRINFGHPCYQTIASGSAKYLVTKLASPNWKASVANVLLVPKMALSIEF